MRGACGVTTEPAETRRMATSTYCKSCGKPRTLPPRWGFSGWSRCQGFPAAAKVLSSREVSMVNAAIYLRRPLLVTGRPGTGKSSLAYLIARELGLGPVLRRSVTSRTALKDGLYL